MTTITEVYDVNYSEEIGRGASGRVFMGTRRSDGVPTAIKVIPRVTLSKELLRIISNEIQCLRELSHPHIVKLYDMFEEPSYFFLAMELIRGGELFDRICKRIKYSENDAKELCRIILFAIKHCHDHNIAHRDLKPENLLMAKVDDDSDVKLVDFGFADFCPNGSSLTGQMGTPMYMAPEIWNHDPHGKPVDLWAFGVITYILLAGYPPFSDDNRENLIVKIRSGVFAFHDKYWANVSVEAKDFISKLLIVDPDTRLTVDQALAHRWLTTADPEHRDLLPSLDKLKEFNAKRRIKGAVQAILALGRMKSAMKSVFGGVILSAQTAVDSTVAVSGDDDDALSPRASSSATSSVTPATTVPVSATATGTTTGITSNEHTVRDDIETNAHQLSTLVRRYSSVGVPVLESHASLFSVLSSGSKSTDVPVIRQISKDTDDGDASPHLLVIGEEEISFEVRGEPEQSLARSVSVPLPHSAKREMETQLEMLLSTKQTIIEQISEEQTELEKLNSAEILTEVELVPEQLEQRRQETKRRLSRLEGDLKTNGKKIKILREL